METLDRLDQDYASFYHAHLQKDLYINQKSIFQLLEMRLRTVEIDLFYRLFYLFPFAHDKREKAQKICYIAFLAYLSGRLHLLTDEQAHSTDVKHLQYPILVGDYYFGSFSERLGQYNLQEHLHVFIDFFIDFNGSVLSAPKALDITGKHVLYIRMFLNSLLTILQTIDANAPIRAWISGNFLDGIAGYLVGQIDKDGLVDLAQKGAPTAENLAFRLDFLDRLLDNQRTITDEFFSRGCLVEEGKQ